MKAVDKILYNKGLGGIIKPKTLEEVTKELMLLRAAFEETVFFNHSVCHSGNVLVKDNSPVYFIEPNKAIYTETPV